MNDVRPKRRRFQFGLRTLLISVGVVGVCLGLVGMRMQHIRRQRAANLIIEKYGGYAGPEPGFFSGDITYVRFSCAPYELECRGSWSGRVEFGDKQLDVLSALPGLEELDLNFTQVTDAGLLRLKAFPGVRTLFLVETQITDAGLVDLHVLPRLEGLSLRGTKVSDAGLAHLKALTKLRWLDLSDTKVTDEGVAKLREALPNCDIER